MFPAYSIRDIANCLALGSAVSVVDIPPEAQINVLVEKGSVPRTFAEALVEMFACFASGRVSLQGDRTEYGATELDDVLRDGLADYRLDPPPRSRT